MELNRDQIIKALECISNTGDVLCAGCDYRKYDGLACHRIGANNAIDLIKELTQANEHLSESYDHLEKTKDELLAERARLTEENAKLARSCTELARVQEENARLMREKTALECVVATARNQAKADTVRKMHSMMCEGRVSNDTVVIVANQVAKEMLEGKK